MNILETIFLGLTIVVPGFFLIVMFIKMDRIKKNKKYRNRLLKYFLISLIINGAIFGGLKIYNNNREKNEADNQQNNYNTDNKTDEINKNDVPNNVEPTDDSNTTTSNEPPTTTTRPTTTTTKPVQNNPQPSGNTGTKPVSGGTTSKGFTIEVRDGVTYIDGFLVVNKTYPLPSTYVPTGTHKKVSAEICQECIIEEAYQAFSKMKSDATAQGLNIWIQSGYRSYSYQGGLYNSYVKRSGKEAADTFSARPGHSEHQSGYAFDLNTITDAFASTKEGIWVNENCYKYGFIIRYPKGKENETGYKYESWHLRYVGTDLASKLYNAGDWITMEDYFGITSQYSE